MKNEFTEYFRPDKKQTKKIWQSAIFVFDTNILLNVYRYPDDAREKFLEVAKGYSDRVWLPHTAANEFFKNRLKVVNSQVAAYKKTLKQIEELEQSLENTKQHPFLSEDSMEKLTTTLSEIKSELSENKSDHAKRIQDDDILESLADAFEKRVGSPFSEDDLERIFKEGEQRYSEKVPPGYKDADKDRKEDDSLLSTDARKYGDLLIWKEIIAKATAEKRNIVFVTDDRKEDWWVIQNGMTLSPRPELIKEFMSETGFNFLMYTMDRFLTHAGEDLNIQMDNSVVEDVREVGNLSSKLISPKEVAVWLEEATKTATEGTAEFLSGYAQTTQKSALKNEIESIKDEIKYITERQESLHLNKRFIANSGGYESSTYIKLENESEELKHRTKMLNFKLQELENMLWSISQDHSD